MANGDQGCCAFKVSSLSVGTDQERKGSKGCEEGDESLLLERVHTTLVAPLVVQPNMYMHMDVLSTITISIGLRLGLHKIKVTKATKNAHFFHII